MSCSHLALSAPRVVESSNWPRHSHSAAEGATHATVRVAGAFGPAQTRWSHCSCSGDLSLPPPQKVPAPPPLLRLETVARPDQRVAARPGDASDLQHETYSNSKAGWRERSGRPLSTSMPRDLACLPPPTICRCLWSMPQQRSTLSSPSQTQVVTGCSSAAPFPSLRAAARRLLHGSKRELRCSCEHAAGACHCPACSCEHSLGHMPRSHVPPVLQWRRSLLGSWLMALR